MRRLNEVLLAALCVAAIGAAVCVAIFLHQATKTAAEVQTTVNKAGEIIDQVKADEPAIAHNLNGVIDSISTVATTTNQTIGQVKQHEAELTARMRSSGALANLE